MSLQARLKSLEVASAIRTRPYAHLSDEELMTRILRLAAGKEPDPADVAQCMTLPVDELKRRLKGLQAERARLEAEPPRC